MVFSSLTALLTLSALTLAVPHNGKHHFHGTGIGTGGSAQPTGGSPLNGTEGGPFGNGTEAGYGAPAGSIPAITATVVPVPEGSGVADATKGPEDFASPANINQGQAASSPVADATAPADGGVGGSDDTCTTVTTTATSIQYVTVTAGAGEGKGESKPSDVPVSVPAGFEAPKSNVTAASSAAPSGSPGAFYEGGKPSEASVSVPAGLEAPESSVTTASSTTPAVSGGAFYGGGNHFSSPSGGYGQSSAAVPTTMATSYGGGAPISSAAPAPAAAPASSAAGSVPSTTPSTPLTGGSGGKRGLSFNKASSVSAFAGSSMSWSYNWADSAGASMPSGIEYVPMCWSGKSGPTFGAKAAGASHVLSFNEPDLGAQANMDPSTAAADHIKYLNPLSGQAQIGSPAITNGAGTSPLMGIDWLKAFFKACNGQCKVDFVAFHWYDRSTNFGYFKNHVNDVIAAAAANNVGKVWLTEFATTDGDSPDFIKQATAFLDSNPAVERYAYFMADNILEKGGSLTSAGQAYAA